MSPALRLILFVAVAVAEIALFVVLSLGALPIAGIMAVQLLLVGWPRMPPRRRRT